MNNIEVEKILKGIRFEIDDVWSTFNIEPNKIIIGTEVLLVRMLFFI